jgi:mono/diheme cytochrome c family protein
MQLRLLKQATASLILVLTIAACSNGSDSREAADSSGVPDDVMVAGKAVYNRSCLACHLASGKGAPPMNPPLIGTSFVLGEKAALINIVLNGMSNTVVDGENYKNVMPGFNFLTDEEIANVLTYIRNSFGNTAEQVTPGEVAQARATK